MKYKYPKKITIGSTVWSIKYDKTKDDGTGFLYPRKGQEAIITFGMKDHKEDHSGFLNLVLHELTEIVYEEQAVRLYNGGLDAFEFHMDHRHFDASCSRAAGLLSQFIK